MLILSDRLIDVCKNSTIFIDTNVFIQLAFNKDLETFLKLLHDDHGVAFITLSSVEYEFTRGSQNLKEISDRRDFIHEFCEVMKVGHFLERPKNDAFSVCLSLVLKKGDSQYTDHLLALALHAYKNGLTRHFVLSADAKAFPLDLFKLEGTIAIDNSQKSVTHFNLYDIDEAKYAALLQSLDKKPR